MGIRESALNTITSLANGDFVRMVTAAGASRKVSLQTIAQHILETYTGTSLAGSNQSVKAAIDGLNSTMNTGITSENVISFDPIIGSAYANYGGVYYYKRGTRVHVHVGMSGLTANARNNIFVLPTGYRPLTNIAVAGKGGGSAMALCAVQIAQSGQVSVSSVDAYALCDIEFDISG